MDFKQTTLTDILTMTLYVIPIYQRSYSWTEREVDDFWQDMVNLKEGHHHFMGTVVLCEKDEIMSTDHDKCKVYEIVDGQQRLTTIMILLRVLRNKFVSLSKIASNSPSEKDARQTSDLKKQAERIDDLLSIVQESTQQRVYRLQPNGNLLPFWITRIIANDVDLAEEKALDVVDEKKADQTEVLIAAEKKLLASHKRLSKLLYQKLHQLPSLGAASQEMEVKSLYTKLKNNLQFTVFKTKDDTSVGIMFETLNNRGRPLSEMDKVKNYLLYTASTRIQGRGEADRARLQQVVDAVKNCWSTVLHEISAFHLVESDEEWHEDLLIRYHRLSVAGPTKTRRAAQQYSKLEEFSKVKEHLIAQYSSDNDNVEFVCNTLVKYCETLSQSVIMYCTLHNPYAIRAYEGIINPTKQSKLRHWTWKLLQLHGVKPFCPLLMQARRICLMANGDIHDHFLTLLAYCEVYLCLVYKVKRCKLNTGLNKLNTLAADLAREPPGAFMSIINVIKEIKGLTRKHCKQSPNCSELNRLDKRNPDLSFMKYVLFEYERDLRLQIGSRPLPDIDMKTLEVEHVLPQEKDGQQLAQEWLDAFTDLWRTQYCNSIGNLSLTTRARNNHYGNKVYSIKQGSDSPSVPDCYLNSPFLLERQFREYDIWDKDTCTKRRARINAWMDLRWSHPIDGPKDAIAKSFDVKPFFGDIEHSSEEEEMSVDEEEEEEEEEDEEEKSPLPRKRPRRNL